MKKILSVLVCAFLFLSSCTVNNKSSRVTGLNEKTKIECTFNLFDYYIDNDYNIYVADKEEVFMITPSGEKKAVVKGLDFCSQIVVYKDLIYTLDVMNSSRLVAYDKSGNKAHEIPIDIGIALHMKLIDEYIFILHQDKVEAAKKYITMVDLDKKETKELKYDNINNFCGFTKGKIFLSLKSDSQQYIYDYIKDELIKKDISHINYRDIYYDSNENALYYVQDKYIKRIDLNNNIDDTVYTALEASLDNIVVFDNYCFAANYDTDTIYAVKKSPDNKNKNITILSHTSSLERNPKIEKAVEIFNKSNENITVNFQSHNSMDYYDSLIVKFMSNAKDFDIFCLDNDDSYYFIKNKVMLDLGIYSSITDKFNNMFDGIKQNHVINNELIGVPLNINLQAWLVNEQLREILDIDCPVSTWTWDDFYDLACEAQKDLNGDGSPDTYALSYSRRFTPFVDQFISYNIDLINSKASFDKDALIHLLNLWKSMASKNLVLEIDFSERTSKQDNILFTTESISLMEGNKTIVRPPIIEEQEVYPVSINNFCINKNSLNKELSAEFLATFLSHEVQAMYPESGNAYYEDISYYKAESNNNYFGTLSNDINYNLYKNMLSKSRRKVYQKDFNIYFGDIFEDFMNNKLSAEKAVDLIAEKAGIIIRE